MKLESQLTSLKLSKRLEKLGVPQKSLFYWIDVGHPDGESVQFNSTQRRENNNSVSAFTVAELGKMLPEWIGDGEEYHLELDVVTSPKGREYRLWYEKTDEDGGYIPQGLSADRSEANARAKLLIYLLENKYV